MHDCIVVGSGPAGVSAAAALLKRGRSVLLLDGGLQLESDRQSTVRAMRQSEPLQWSPTQLACVREGMESTREGIPLKRLFGSDFPYRDTDRFASLQRVNSDVAMSLAVGGLSNVWGAGVIPFTADDMSDWPLSPGDLAPFYRECFEEMELSAVSDDLAGNYPLFTDRPGQLRMSSQAEEFMSDLVRNRSCLRRAGIHFGRSRLAVKAASQNGSAGCAYCGLCLYGCPYGYIYNSADRIDELAATNRLQHFPDALIQTAEESADAVTLFGRHRRSGGELRMKARQVFLGCGTIATSAILLASLNAFDQPVRIKDSQYFLFPLLRFRGSKAVEQEALHTLAQLFIEIHDRSLCSKSVHLSVYTYNDLLLSALRKQVGAAARIWPSLPAALAGHLLICGGYLHSDASPSLELAVSKSACGTPTIHLRGLPRLESNRIVRRLLRKLTREAFHLRALPLAPLLKRGLPGRGFHIGGSFPMSLHPKRFESDACGRPSGFEHLHVIDASCFPNVPAPNLTLTVMANARRIAHAACNG